MDEIAHRNHRPTRLPESPPGTIAGLFERIRSNGLHHAGTERNRLSNCTAIETTSATFTLEEAETRGRVPIRRSGRTSRSTRALALPVKGQRGIALAEARPRDLHPGARLLPLLYPLPLPPPLEPVLPAQAAVALPHLVPLAPHRLQLRGLLRMGPLALELLVERLLLLQVEPLCALRAHRPHRQ